MSPRATEVYERRGVPEGLYTLHVPMYALRRCGSNWRAYGVTGATRLVPDEPGFHTETSTALLRRACFGCTVGPGD